MVFLVKGGFMRVLRIFLLFYFFFLCQSCTNLVDNRPENDLSYLYKTEIYTVLHFYKQENRSLRDFCAEKIPSEIIVYIVDENWLLEFYNSMNYPDLRKISAMSMYWNDYYYIYVSNKVNPHRLVVWETLRIIGMCQYEIYTQDYIKLRKENSWMFEIRDQVNETLGLEKQ